jgi:hypothetical protein
MPEGEAAEVDKLEHDRWFNPGQGGVQPRSGWGSTPVRVGLTRWGGRVDPTRGVGLTPPGG